MESRNRIERHHLLALAGEVMKTPFSWAVWAGAGLFGMAFDQVPLAVAAALAMQGLTVAVALRDPDLIRNALRSRSENEARRLLGQGSEDAVNVDAVTRRRLDAILAAYVAVCRECTARDVPRYARPPLAGTIARMDLLAARASGLAARRNELAAYLEDVNRSELRGQQASLRVRNANAGDPVLKTQLEQSLHFKGEEISAYDAIALAISRMDGQLETVECAFAALKARLLRFKSDEKTEWMAAGEQLRNEMDSLSGQIDALNDSVREVLTLRGAA